MARGELNLSWKRNVEGIKASAKKKRQEAYTKTEDAIKTLIRQKEAINFETVSKAASVSRWWLYNQPALRNRIETLREQQKVPTTNIELPPCPKCSSPNTKKNGHRPDGKQTYKCIDCGRQFVAIYDSVGYPLQVKECCLKLHSRGMSMRSIERATGVCHTTVRTWVKQFSLF